MEGGSRKQKKKNRIQEKSKFGNKLTYLIVRIAMMRNNHIKGQMGKKVDRIVNLLVRKRQKKRGRTEGR